MKKKKLPAQRFGGRETNAKRRRSKRPNPARKHEIREIKIPAVLKDAVFMHHFAGAVSRYLELEYPVEYQITRMIAEAPPPDPIQGWEKIEVPEEPKK
jgi:hypothetical protein